ncbi:ComEC/Rec2 family competence protein [Microbacterium tumbae]
MTRRDLRLVPIAAGAWAMALICVFAPAIAWWCAGCAVIVAASLLSLAGAGRHRSWAPLLAVLCATSAGVAMTVAFATPWRSEAARSDGRVVTIEADIASSSSIGADGRLWFDAQTVRMGPGDARSALSVPVRIGIELLDGAELGARIRVLGEAMATDAGERAVLVVFATRAEITGPAGGAFAVAADVRADFSARAVRLPEPGAGLLPGLAVGDTRAMSPELNAAILASGLSHLTAVSGANCAIVVAAAFWFVAFCGGGRRLRVILAIGALAAFVVLVTPEPSVIRASVMAGLAMITVLLGRPSAGVGVLCLAVIGILLADPWLAATPGFALSAAATGALILLAPPLARGMERWMPQPLALAIGVPLAAQLVCGPIIALFSEQQSLIGVVANLLAAPAAPIATVVGLLACLASPAAPLADLLAASAWLPAAWIAATATMTAALPGAQLLVAPGVLTAVAVLVLGAALGVLLWRNGGGLPPPRVITRTATAVLVIAVALGGARTLLDGPLAASATPEGWSVAACDVGQGDALVVRSAGRIALIDTGPEPAPLERCLTSLGVDHLDLVVLTHFDLDHVGGAAAIEGRTSTLLHGPVAEPEDERLLASLRESGAELVEAAAGQHGALGEAQWRVLWPRADQASFPSGNDASVVIELAGGDVPRSLFLGDLSAVPQQLLAASGTLHAPYAVVKVAHHGSADQDAGLYALLRPSAAIFSAGEGNDYGHPRRETLDLLEAAGSVVLRTDLQGRVLLGVKDGALSVWTERPAAADDADDVARPG